MRKLPFILLLTLTVLVFISCKSGSTDDKAKQDSLKVAEKIQAQQIEKEKNVYLIEPPDTSYTGDYLDKYDNGNVKFKGFFRFGKRHGQWMAFYANGILWSECFYDKGMKHGANNVYFEGGKPRYKGWYKNDLRDSVWIFFDEYGKEIQKTHFKNDEEVPVK